MGDLVGAETSETAAPSETQGTDTHGAETVDGDAANVDAAGCGGDPACAHLDEACRVGRCREGSCVAEDVTGACDDGDKCTTGDWCEAGVCAGDPVVCPALACRAGVCDGETGSCLQLPVEDGEACEDGDECTVGDVCRAGSCVAGGPPDDTIGDFTTVFQATSDVNVHGVAALGLDLVALVSVRGASPLTIRPKTSTEETVVDAPEGSSRYLVLARLDASGRPSWAKALVWSLGEGTRRDVLVGAGGPYVHGATAITIGALSTREVGVERLGTFGSNSEKKHMALRVSADGVPLWQRSISGGLDEGADELLSTLVCASPSGRVAILHPVFAEGLTTLWAQADSSQLTDLTSWIVGDMVSVVAAYTNEGSRSMLFRVIADGGDAQGRACSIGEDGEVVVVGTAVATRLSVRTEAGTEVSLAQPSSGGFFGWGATVSSAGPGRVMVAQSAAPGSPALISGVLAEVGAFWFVGASLGATLTTTSSQDGMLRTLASGNVVDSVSKPVATLFETDTVLRLTRGLRVEASGPSLFETVLRSDTGFLVAGVAEGIQWAGLEAVSQSEAYFVASVRLHDLRPEWGFLPVLVDDPATGDFAVTVGEGRALSIARLGATGVAVGLTVRDVAVLDDGTLLVPSINSTAGAVMVRNSANGLACQAR